MDKTFAADGVDINDIRKKTDRISAYLSAGNREMVFGELSDDFLRMMGGYEMLKGVPVPVGQSENGQIAVRSIFIDMAKVIGGDAAFVYADKYLEYIRAVGGEDAEPILVTEGAKAADEGRFEDACKLLRTALMIDPKSQAAMYLYARACKACYETAAARYEEGETGGMRADLRNGPVDGLSDGGAGSSNESAGRSDESAGSGGKNGSGGDMDADDYIGGYIGNFKAESMDAFEVLTMMHPDFAMGYYFLGYAYLNMGLYLKAKLTWDDFMRLSSSADDDQSGLDYDQLEDLRHEISGMLLDLDEPVEIEKGCNRIMGGDFAGGKDILEKFTEGRYENWWPLWYYLGVAESALGNTEAAIADLKRVLTLSPSNTDVMDELAVLYEAIGDQVNAGKYRNKIKVVREGYPEISQAPDETE